MGNLGCFAPGKASYDRGIEPASVVWQSDALSNWATSLSVWYYFQILCSCFAFGGISFASVQPKVRPCFTYSCYRTHCLTQHIYHSFKATNSFISDFFQDPVPLPFIFHALTMKSITSCDETLWVKWHKGLLNHFCEWPVLRMQAN